MKCGFELELLAPAGSDRRSVAAHFASVLDCSAESIFHRDSDYVPETGSDKAYFCLSRGFALTSPSGLGLKIVNDMTISEELDLGRQDQGDWFHILCDDIRLVELVRRNCEPDLDSSHVLGPLADFFGVGLAQNDRVTKVMAPEGVLVAMAHSFFQDRKRVCEIITSPLTEGQETALRLVLEEAQVLGCSIPSEASFHVHFDGAGFCSPRAVLRLIRAWVVWSAVIKRLVPPNPKCRRLGAYSRAVVEYAFDLSNEDSSWSEVKAALLSRGASKYCDCNFINLLLDDPAKCTVEIRIIPMNPDSVALWAATQFFFQFLSLSQQSESDFNHSPFVGTDEDVHRLLLELEQIAD
jgi:hypothetical protein